MVSPKDLDLVSCAHTSLAIYTSNNCALESA